MKLRQSVSPGTMKQAAVGKTRPICAEGTASMRICAVLASRVSAMSIPASRRSRASNASRSPRYDASPGELM